MSRLYKFGSDTNQLALQSLGKMIGGGLDNPDLVFGPDPYRDIISELVRSYEEESSIPWHWDAKGELVTVHKDDTSEQRMLILFEQGTRPQLFILTTIALRFELVAYLGNLTEEQVSFMHGYLAAKLPSVVFPRGPMPMDFRVYDHNLDSWGFDQILFGKPFEDHEKVRAFGDFLNEGHWAHLTGLRPRAALDMTEFTALKLVFDTWVRFIVAIREAQTPLVSRSPLPGRPVIEKVEKFLNIDPNVRLDS